MRYLALLLTICASPVIAADRPNVILIMTDDQGYGDLGFHGNPILRTPHLDTMAERSARWEPFYVSPVCTPTRACLMTGRYNYRTRAIDTYRGRAMMEPAEHTVAELLRPAGYASGIFGKWHLGDSYPLRPMDQGFDTSLVHRGGGIGQPSDPPGAEGKYTDPTLFRNGEAEHHHGYCTDVYFSEGLKWADEQNRQEKPFFLYLPTNAPHGPYGDVPTDKLDYYRKQMIAADRFPETEGHAPAETLNVDQLARVYAMIENIDDNVGRVFQWLEERQLTDDTLVIFITDNGPASVGWNAGLRGRKADVFEGGIRSPAFFHWPGQFEAGPRGGRIAAHIDLTPTVLEVCGIEQPAEAQFDGRSLLSALKLGQADWPERTLFFQSHRGDVPYPRHHCAIRGERWKLVHPSGFGKESFEGEVAWMLFDLDSDPFEQHDQASQQPDIVRDLAQRYDAWFADVSSTRPDNYAPPRIIVGSPKEKTTILTRQDWRGADWKPESLGFWLIDVANTQAFTVRVRFVPVNTDGTVRLHCGDEIYSQPAKPGTAEVVFRDISLAAGPMQVSGSIAAAGRTSGVMFVELQGE